MTLGVAAAAAAALLVAAGTSTAPVQPPRDDPAADPPAARASAPDAPLAWDEAFTRADAAPAVHVVARYRGGDGGWHRLEAWRRGESFVHRRTDDRMDLYVEADPSYAGHYRYQVADPARKVLIEVDRTNLLRIGVFSDWSSLAHLMKPAAAGVRVRAMADPRAADANPVAPCRWFEVDPAPGALDAPLDVCWSRELALPVRVQARPAGRSAPEPMLELTQAEALPAAAAATLVPASLPPDFTFVDANADIDPAGD